MLVVAVRWLCSDCFCDFLPRCRYRLGCDSWDSVRDQYMYSRPVFAILKEDRSVTVCGYAVIACCDRVP